MAGDSSGHGNDGEIRGAEWVRGKFGTALHFGGREAYVTIPGLASVDAILKTGQDNLLVGRFPATLINTQDRSVRGDSQIGVGRGPGVEQLAGHPRPAPIALRRTVSRRRFGSAALEKSKRA